MFNFKHNSNKNIFINQEVNCIIKKKSMSCSFLWWAIQGSNLWPLECRSSALPTAPIALPVVLAFNGIKFTPLPPLIALLGFLAFNGFFFYLYPPVNCLSSRLSHKYNFSQRLLFHLQLLFLWFLLKIQWNHHSFLQRTLSCVQIYCQNTRKQFCKFVHP